MVGSANTYMTGQQSVEPISGMDGNAGIHLQWRTITQSAAWGPCTDDPCLADVTGDDIVDTSDLLYLLASWGPCETN
ncbi:MAG: hypothetical protein HN811_00485 [Phycisphaerae bacterium]|jgi:hypothetical protein|nr:hypothetical protein [Phycisphaerae bacterium]